MPFSWCVDFCVGGGLDASHPPGWRGKPSLGYCQINFLILLELTNECSQAAQRFFKRLLRGHGSEPRKIVTDKLRSYGVAHRELFPETIHSTQQYENNVAEQSHESTKVRERGMRRLKSVRQAQRFLHAHAIVINLLNLGRYLVRAQHYRNLRVSSVGEREAVVA
jgi:putative transposase